MHFEDKRHWKAILFAQRSCRSSLCVCHFPPPCGCGGSANWGHPDRAGSPHICSYSCSRLPIILFTCHCRCLSQLNGPLSTGAHLCGVISLQGEGLAELSQRVEGCCVCLSALLDHVFFAFGCSCGHTGTANLTYKVTLIFSRLSNHGKIWSCVGSPWPSLCLHLTRCWFVCCHPASPASVPMCSLCSWFVSPWPSGLSSVIVVLFRFLFIACN